MQMYETLVAVVQEGEKESEKKLLLPQVLDHFTRQLGIAFGDTTIWRLGERVDGKSIPLDERERVFSLEQRLISPTVLRLIQEAEAMVISR